MELIGLLVFSISMALFGAYQTVPFTNIGPDIILPMRLRGGFRLGYALGRIGDAVQLAIPQEETDAVLSMSMSDLARVIGTPIPLSTSVEQLTLAPARSWPATTTGFTDMPTKTETLVIVIVTAPATEMSDSERAWEDRIRVQDILDAGEEVIRRIFSSWPDPLIFAQAIAYTIYASALLCVLGASLFIILSVYTVCRRAGLDFVTRATLANREIDLIFFESESQRSFLRERLAALNLRMTKEMDEATELIATKKMEILTKLQLQEELLQKAVSETSQVSNNLRRAAEQMEAQYIPFPRIDQLLGEHITVFKDTLDKTTLSLLSQTNNAASLIPKFKKEYEKTVTTLRKDNLGLLPEIFRQAKTALERDIARLHDESKGLPAISDLEDKAQQIKYQVGETKNDLQIALRDNKATLRQLPKMGHQLAEFQSEISRLKHELATTRLALNAAQGKELERLAIGSETPAGPSVGLVAVNGNGECEGAAKPAITDSNSAIIDRPNSTGRVPTQLERNASCGNPSTNDCEESEIKTAKAGPEEDEMNENVSAISRETSRSVSRGRRSRQGLYNSIATTARGPSPRRWQS